MTLQEQLTQDAIGLLKQLIATQSFSREEDKTGDILEEFFRERNILLEEKSITCGHEISILIPNFLPYYSIPIMIL
jgi:hypothetical protein